MKPVLTIIAFALVAAVAYSDDNDDLFGEGLVSEPQEPASGLEETLLVSESVEIGGQYRFDLEAAGVWDDAFEGGLRYREADELSLSTRLSSRLYFDARPHRDFRVYGRVTVSYPFETNSPDGDDPAAEERNLQDVFRVEELFSDFTWRDAVYFRGGLQTLGWGVGTFFAPADLLNPRMTMRVDPDLPRRGRVGVRASIPAGINNADVYLLLPERAEPQPLDAGIAARGDLVAGRGEVSLGAFYQHDAAPAAMVAATRSLGDFDLFTEAVLRYGSERIFVEESAGFPGLSVRETDDEMFVSAMAGLRYTYDPAESTWGFRAIGEYFRNGEGYRDPSVITDNRDAIGVLLGEGLISADDLATTGRHYTALSGAFTDLLGTDLSVGLLWVRNYTDRSSLLVPSVSGTVFNRITLTLSSSVSLGDKGDELAPQGNRLAVSVGASIGGGSF